MRIFEIDSRKGSVAGWCAALRGGSGNGAGVLKNLPSCPIYPGRSCNTCPAASENNWGTMSRYVVGEVVFEDLDALCATMEHLFGKGSLERTADGQNGLTAYGYVGKSRDDEIGKVAAVVRRDHVGAGANDLPIRKESDGSYRIIVSEYDQRNLGERLGKKPGLEYWSGCEPKDVENRFKAAYAEQRIIIASEKKGYKVERTIGEDGLIRLTATSGGGRAPMAGARSGRYSV